MHFSTMAHVLGLVGITPMRAFLPAFLTALVMRIGGIPYLTDAAMADATAAPSWFTHTFTLTVLGLLSLVEFLVTKSPEARQVLSTIDEYYKPALAALTSFGVLSASDANAVETLHGGIIAPSLFPIAAITLGSAAPSLLFSIKAAKDGASPDLACLFRAKSKPTETYYLVKSPVGLSKPTTEPPSVLKPASEKESSDSFRWLIGRSIGVGCVHGWWWMTTAHSSPNSS